MRTSIAFFALGLLLMASSCTQNPAAPDVVKIAFGDKFPEAIEVTWSMEDATSWEAEFKLEDTNYSSNFNLQGDWLETEHEIKKSELPASILTFLEQEYLDYKIDEVEISEKAEGKFYELAVEKGEEEWELVFASDGRFIEKENSN